MVFMNSPEEGCLFTLKKLESLFHACIMAVLSRLLIFLHCIVLNYIKYIVIADDHIISESQPGPSLIPGKLE